MRMTAGSGGRRAGAHRLISTELVGRDGELGAIGQLVGAVASGSHATLLISGEAGLGKTAVLARALDICRHNGLRALRGDCVRFEMGRAFGPFVDALHAARDEPWATSSVTDTSPDEIVPADASAPIDRYRRHLGFVGAFAAAAEHHPLAVAIDDLHWADESTLELFAHLSRRLPRGMMLVGTYRPEEVGRRPALRHALGDIPIGRRSDLALARLTASEVGRALRLILGPAARVTAETREVLQARSGGNPLFLEEMLRSLAQRGDLRQIDGAWRLGPIRDVPLPVSVQEAVAERFAAFDAPTRDLLRVAATAGERFDLEVVRRASGLPPDRVIGGIREAVAGQLVVEQQAATGERFAFRHPLIRDALLWDLLRTERRELHRRLAVVLEARGPRDDDVSGLAYHWDEAGDRDRAFAAHVRAGEHEARHFAHAEALRHFERALAIAPQDDRTVAELSRHAVAMARVLARAGSMLTHATRAVTAFERTRDARRLGPALIAMQSAAEGMLWPRSERRKLIERAFAVLEPLGDSRELANAHTAAATFAAIEAAMHPLTGPDGADAALAHARRAVDIADRVGGDREIAYWGLALAHVIRGERDAAIAAFREGVAACRDERIAAPHQINNFELLADLVEEVDGTTAEVRDLRQRSAALRERYGVMQTYQARMHHLFLSGDWDEYLRTSDDHGDDTNESAYVLTHQALHRSFIEVARGGPVAIAAARAAYERVLASEDVSETDAVAAPEVALLVGDHGWALEATERAAELVVRPNPYSPFITFAGIYAVLAAVDARDDAAAATWLARFPATFPTTAISFNRRVVEQTVAYGALERAWREGRRDEAIEALARLIDERIVPGQDQGRTTLPGLGVWTLLTYFLALREIDMRVDRGAPGDVDRAAARLAWVVGFYRRCGAAWYVERLRERAAAWQIPFLAEAAPAAAPRLTRREREVALLVAKGLTNRQIADHLTLSVRTAESHVERIRAKLGFKTRAQVASWATEAYGPLS